MGLLYLFFVKDSTLFGITYISYHHEYASKAYSTEGVNTIVLNSRSYDVVVVPSSSEQISASVYAKSLGYVLTKHSQVKVVSSVEDGTVTVNVTEPYGVAFKNKSYIELRIPEGLSPNLVLKNKNAYTVINREKINLASLTYTTTAGDFEFLNGSISGKLDLTLNRSAFTLSKNVKTTGLSAELSLTSGKFYAGSHTFSNVEVTKNTRGVVELKSCDSFSMKVKSAGGKILIGSASSVDIESSDTNVEIAELYGGSIILTETGKVKVGAVKGVSAIETNSGSIKINSAETTVATVSKSGDQTILKATKKVSAESTYGNIKVIFDETAGDYAESTDNSTSFRCLLAFTKNGKITATGVDNVNVGIVENGTGRVDITMRKVTGNNVIDAKRGEVKMTIANDAIYNLTTKSESGDVYVNVGQFAVEGYTTKELTTNIICPFEGDYVTNNSLTVSTTSGALSITDVMVSELN